MEDKIPSRKERLSVSAFFRKKLDPGLNCVKLWQLFNSMNDNKRNVFEFFFSLLAKGMYIEPSQAYIAKCLGISVRTVNRIIKWFKDHGIIDVYTRGRKKTAIYKLSPIFYEADTWELLQEFNHTFMLLATKSIKFKAFLGLRPITTNRGSKSARNIVFVVVPNIKLYDKRNIHFTTENTPTNGEEVWGAEARRAAERLTTWGEEEHKKIIDEHEEVYISIFGIRDIQKPEINRERQARTTKIFKPWDNSDWYRAKMNAAEQRALSI